jgi:hypothetical protein
VWVIPLGNGETSVGVVWDRRLIALHERTDREAAFLEFVRSIPALAELLDGATPRSEDFRHYSRLAYCTRQYMGRGWAMVGDAAAFLDPYYSPGLDHVGFSVDATVEIVREQSRGLAGELLDRRIAAHNEEFLRSYRRFFAAVFKDKYFYMGEHDLLSAAALLDTAQYYLFLVIPAYRVLGRYNWHPVLGPKPAGFNYWLMRFYNRRFKAIAEARRAAGRAGLRNNGRRVRMFFALDYHAFHMALRGAKLWLFAELDLLAIRLGLRRRNPDGAREDETTETTWRAPAPSTEPGP